MLLEAHIYFAVALAGLFSFLSPCVLPLVPPYLGFLGGTTVSQVAADEGREDAVWRRVVLGSVFFVLGFTTVFVALGAGASSFGQLIQAYQAPLAKIAGVVIILFGLHFLGLLKIPLLVRLHSRVGVVERVVVGPALPDDLHHIFGQWALVEPHLVIDTDGYVRHERKVGPPPTSRENRKVAPKQGSATESRGP